MEKKNQVEKRAPGVTIDLTSTEQKWRHNECTFTKCEYVEMDKRDESLRTLGCLCYGNLKQYTIYLKSCPGQKHYESGRCLFNVKTHAYEPYEGNRYAAISHCWGQFLFTDGRRALSCLLKDLRDNLEPYGITHVWTDVWCLYQGPDEDYDKKPSAPPGKPAPKLTPEQEARKQDGLNMMTDIYKKADFVLVYDTTQYVSKAHCGTSTWFLNNALSAWNERIWTLQEVALSDKVIFMGRIPISAADMFPFAAMPMTGRAGSLWITELWHALPSSNISYGVPNNIKYGNNYFSFDKILRLCTGRFSAQEDDQWRGICGLLEISTPSKKCGLREAAKQELQSITSIEESLAFNHGLHLVPEIGPTWLPKKFSTAVYEVYGPIVHTRTRARISEEGLHVQGSLYMLRSKGIRLAPEEDEEADPTIYDYWYTVEGIRILLEADSDAMERDMVLFPSWANDEAKSIVLIGKGDKKNFTARAGIYGSYGRDYERFLPTTVIIV